MGAPPASPPRGGFIELTSDASEDGGSGGRLATVTSSTSRPASDGLSPRGKCRPLGRIPRPVRIPRLVRPLCVSCALVLGCLLAGALAPADSLPRVVVYDCWGWWAWLVVLCFPLWVYHLFVVVLAGLRATARFGIARAGVTPRHAGEHPEPARILGWLPAGDALILLVTWLAIGSASTWAWGSRALGADFFEVVVTPESLIFPTNFSWGAATAAYQVEGGLYNTNWYKFEQDFKHADGSRAIADGWECGIAADSWNRFDEDLACMRELGIRSYRFGVEWSRIEPLRGSFNATAMARYVNWTHTLRANHIEPLVTLHHFTEPLWRTELGGLENISMAVDFERYVRYVALALAPTVDWWVTVNEIMVVAAIGWLSGEFPPGKQNDFPGMMRAVDTMVEMHRSAFRALHELDTIAWPGGQGKPCLVSVAQNVVLWSPGTPWLPTEALVAGFVEGYYNRWVLERLLRARPTSDGPLGARGSGLDYIGLNHYFSQVVLFGGFVIDFASRFARSDMDWSLDPGSLHEVVTQYHKWAPELPIVITEHGTADNSAPDVRRVEFLQKSLLGLREAVTAGDVPVIGYTHWALIDNFEWAKGFTPRFGLYRVDWKNNLRREITGGGRRYQQIIAANVEAAEEERAADKERASVSAALSSGRA